MKHLGDIQKLNGGAIEPVDVITGGSPCQDLSTANGNREGLAGKRSGLFMDQVRIVKEMREADVLRGRSGKFIRPRYMVWENVPGAFSSNGGKDFQSVISEIVHIRQPKAPLCLCLKTDGLLSDAYTMYWDAGQLLGQYMTHAAGAFPSEEREFHLSQILEDSPHQKYYLSAEACQGILRRARKREKKLPQMMEEALLNQIENAKHLIAETEQNQT